MMTVRLWILFNILLFSSALWAIEEEKKTSDINFVVIIEKSERDIELPRLESILNKRLVLKSVSYSEGEDYECYEKVCDHIAKGVSFFVDLTWKGWTQAENLASSMGIPYIRVDSTNRQFVQAADDYLQNRNASDAALVFSSEAELDQALLYLIGNSIIRMLVLDNINASIANNLKQMRPLPSNYVIYGKADEVMMMFITAYENLLVTRESKWTLVLQNFAPFVIHEPTNGTISKIIPEPRMCCYLLNLPTSIQCKCESRKINKLFVELVLQLLADTIEVMVTSESGIMSVKGKCKEIDTQTSSPKQNSDIFYEFLEKAIDKKPYHIQLKDKMLSMKYTLNIDATIAEKTEKMGIWTTDDNFVLDISQQGKVIKRFLKIGIALTTPFTFEEKHENGTTFFDGFCIRLLMKIAEQMQFEYEYVLPPNNLYGTKHENGSWDGLIGDLVNGVTDIVIAALTMTSEREEAVDFVAPHFDQSGISIVMRKPEREVSLFKFMSVLEPEVWWCILAAIIVTALVLWLLDKYSPFSGQNKKRYPYECRKFTLVECFWFALTSITPQGGGEPPKAVSGRILVAAYWLFVVLMLATFTANLAAFLTVERMQSPVRSLEELAKQSKINYTVVKESSIEQYFINMAGAEDELYRVWKDITLNTSNDQAKYRVWDYPIKEQYNRILNVIRKTGMMKSAEEGFEKVKQDKESTFAFIHDAAEIKYEVYRSCDLTEIGEAFAEQPYAIAVQSGSYLQEEISRVLLDLQKDRYFEQLYNIFWNSSAKRNCPNSDETEGITLQSLGGVFIATLVGLAIGMLTLVGEVLYYKKKRTTPIQPMDNSVEKISKSSRRSKDNTRMRTINVRPRIPNERY